MLGGFYAVLKKRCRLCWSGEVYYNGIKKPVFSVYLDKMNKKQASVALFNGFREYLRENKEKIINEIWGGSDAVNL